MNMIPSKSLSRDDDSSIICFEGRTQWLAPSFGNTLNMIGQKSGRRDWLSAKTFFLCRAHEILLPGESEIPLLQQRRRQRIVD